jgi:predicted nucleic acid-binding protein
MAAALMASGIDARRRKAGRVVEIRDTQIAGIAMANHATLVTRNVHDFSDLELLVVNPWRAA